MAGTPKTLTVSQHVFPVSLPRDPTPLLIKQQMSAVEASKCMKHIGEGFRLMANWEADGKGGGTMTWVLEPLPLCLIVSCYAAPAEGE